LGKGTLIPKLRQTRHKEVVIHFVFHFL